MMNLLNNAVKYAPETDEITIDIEHVDSVIKVSVSDNGAGIPANSRNKLFDRYYRVDKKRQMSGLELGLYI